MRHMDGEAGPVLRKVPGVWVVLVGEFSEQTWERPNALISMEQLAEEWHC